MAGLGMARGKAGLSRGGGSGWHGESLGYHPLAANSLFEQNAGPFTGLHRATAPSGRLTEYPVQVEGSEAG